LIQKYEKSLGLGLGLEIKGCALVLVLKIMELLVLTTKSYLHHWLGWETVCRPVHYLSITTNHEGQLSLPTLQDR